VARRQTKAIQDTPPLHRQIADLMVDASDPDVSDACCVILKHLAMRNSPAPDPFCDFNIELSGFLKDGPGTDSGGSE
jgi:hypothetical protein